MQIDHQEMRKLQEQKQMKQQQYEQLKEKIETLRIKILEQTKHVVSIDHVLRNITPHKDKIQSLNRKKPSQLMRMVSNFFFLYLSVFSSKGLEFW